MIGPFSSNKPEPAYRPSVTSRMAMASPSQRVHCAFRTTRGNRSNAYARSNQCDEPKNARITSVSYVAAWFRTDCDEEQLTVNRQESTCRLYLGRAMASLLSVLGELYVSSRSRNRRRSRGRLAYPSCGISKSPPRSNVQFGAAAIPLLPWIVTLEFDLGLKQVLVLSACKFN
jgi:hypothetical protein